MRITKMLSIGTDFVLESNSDNCDSLCVTHLLICSFSSICNAGVTVKTSLPMGIYWW